MARAKQLKFHGKKTVESVDDQGEPITFGYDRFFYGIPPRDLDEADIKKLDDDQYKQATTDPGNGQGALYTPVEAKKQQAKAPTKKQVAAKQAKAERSQQAKREAPKQEAQQEATSEAKGGEGDSGAGSQGGE